VERRLLFVIGLARSGTTALTRLLNSHPEIALGMERYKLLVLHGQGDELGPELFAPDRFFDFGDGDTTLTPDASPRWATYYRDLAEKYVAATYVGDKVTTVRIRRLLERFPDARIVTIVRDPVEVAASWQRRADDPDDRGWRPSRGAPEAAVEWNRGVRRLLRALDRTGGRVRVVEHRTFFGDSAGASVHGLLDWLGLSSAAATDAAFARMHDDFVALRGRPISLSSEHQDVVEATVDHELWRTVKALVGQ